MTNIEEIKLFCEDYCIEKPLIQYNIYKRLDFC